MNNESKSGYAKDAETTLKNILTELHDLFEGFEEQNERTECMKEARTVLQNIYAGWMDLGKTIAK